MWPARCTRSLRRASRHKSPGPVHRMHQKRGDEPCRKKHPETRSPWAGDRCLHGAGSQYRRTAGCIPGQRACSFCAGSGVDGCCAGCCAELRSRAEQCRCSALVHGCGSLCRCRCSSLCAGCTAACSGRRFTAPGAPAGRAAARPAEKGAQTTPQRKKNCKKAQKELAKPAPHDV